MPSCRTRGFEFSPRTPRKRALRDTEGVYEISLRAIRPLIVRNTLGTFYLWGSTPDPMPKADIKTKKFCGIYMVILSEGNFPNPSVSGELQASRLPRHPWLKIPRQILTSQTITKRRIYPIFHHFSPKGTVPQAIHNYTNSPLNIFLILL